METTIKKIDDGLIELSVRLDRGELETYVLNVEQQMGAGADIPGFRKGKAPQNLIRQHLNPEAVRQAALEISVSQSLAKAVQEKELDVAQSVKLDVKENAADHLLYTATLSIYPTVTVPDLQSVKVARRPITASEKEVQESIDVIRNMRARFEVKEAVAAMGDRVEVDFQVSMNGSVIEGGESKNHPLIIGGKNFMPGFEDQLVGMKAGDEKEFLLTAPGDYYHKKIAGKKLDFKVKVHLVQSVTLPEQNDEFAKGLGQFKDFQELRANVQKGIMREKEAQENQRVRLEALGKIAEAAKITPPVFLVQQQLDSMMDQFARDLQEKGLELPMHLAQIGKSEEDLRKDWEKDAQHQAQLVLALRAVARKQKISADPQELEAAVTNALQSLASRGQTDVQNLDAEKLRDRIEDRLIQEKTFEYIEKSCVTV